MAVRFQMLIPRFYKDSKQLTSKEQQLPASPSLSTVIASGRIVFWDISWGSIKLQMCSNVSLVTLKCFRHRWSWYQLKKSCSNEYCGLDKPILSCACDHWGCFAAGLPGLQQSLDNVWTEESEYFRIWRRRKIVSILLPNKNTQRSRKRFKSSFA